MRNALELQIDLISKKFLDLPNKEKIQIMSHFDTDGISSATIMIQTLKDLDKKFSVKIVKNLEKQTIDSLSKEKIIIFLDLASGSLSYIKNAGFDLKKIFIIDHHEITEKPREVIKSFNIINPELHKKQKISASCLTYLFCKKINPEIKRSAKLAILGMIGDLLEKEVDKLNKNILEDGEIKRKRGLMIYPSTRPINKVLEFCSRPYIPGVTGNAEGVTELLREAGLKSVNRRYKSLLELNEKEMKKLVTAIMLKNPKAKDKEIIGDIFLIKLFNKLEDARELSATINACSRMGYSQIAIQLLMENPNARKKAKSIYIKYKQILIEGLKLAEKMPKIQGDRFVIINTKNQVKDTIIGTVASILSHSPAYKKGTIITTMAEYENKIKISARNVGRTGRNVRKILSDVIGEIGGEVGGHEFAAGGIINQKKEEEFIKLLKRNLEIELIKI